VAQKESPNGWLGLILYLVLAPALWAYLQISLNSVWRAEAEALPGDAPPPEPSDQMPPRLEDEDR
jgi:hypothetical protein